MELTKFPVRVFPDVASEAESWKDDTDILLGSGVGGFNPVVTWLLEICWVIGTGNTGTVGQKI